MSLKTARARVERRAKKRPPARRVLFSWLKPGETVEARKQAMIASGEAPADEPFDLLCWRDGEDT